MLLQSIFATLGGLKPSRLLLGILIVFISIAAPMLVYFDTESGNERFSALASTRISPLEVSPANYNGLFISCNVTSVDLVNQNFKTRFNFEPMGTVALEGSDRVFKRPAADVTVLIAGKEILFPALSPMSSLSIDIPIDIGNVNKYPFDRFYSTFIIYATMANITSGPGPVNVAFAIVGAAQSFRMDSVVKTEESRTSTFVRVQLGAVRSFTVQFFCMFIFCCMWVLGLCVITLAVTLWFRERKVEPPTIGVCAALLFALPAIRNTQPGVPPIGCTIDLAGFFWCMFLTMVSLSLLMTNYIMKYQRDRPMSMIPKDA